MWQSGSITAPFIDNMSMSLVGNDNNRPIGVKVLEKVLTVPANLANVKVFRKHLANIFAERIYQSELTSLAYMHEVRVMVQAVWTKGSLAERKVRHSISKIFKFSLRPESRAERESQSDCWARYDMIEVPLEEKDQQPAFTLCEFMEHQDYMYNFYMVVARKPTELQHPCKLHLMDLFLNIT